MYKSITILLVKYGFELKESKSSVSLFTLTVGNGILGGKVFTVKIDYNQGWIKLSKSLSNGSAFSGVNGPEYDISGLKKEELENVIVDLLTGFDDYFKIKIRESKLDKLI